MDKKEIDLFSDNLPYRLPVWHSVQSANKKYSIYNNQFDLDIIPDYGGHMLDYDKKNDEFKSIKNDCIGKSPFIVKSHLIPFKINLESSEDLLNDRVCDCLVYDQNLNLLISTLAYNHPRTKQLIIQQIDPINSEQFKENDLKENFLISDGNIEQVNKFINTGFKFITHIRQERCLSVLEFKKTTNQCSNDQQLIKTNKVIPENSNERYFYSDHNSRLPKYLVSGSIVNRTKLKLHEIDIDQNARNWSTDFESSSKPLEIKYSEFHPKMFYCALSNQIKLFDSRFSRSTGSIKINKSSLVSINDFDQFRRISNSISNANQLFVASDYNLMLFDIRFPNYVLLQWNHMLSSDTKLCSLKSYQLDKESIFIASRDEISTVSIDKPLNDNLLQPTSLHCPIHLPRLRNIVKCTSITDSRLDDYIERSKIVALDFAFSKEQKFDLFIMTQYGDIFKQKLIQTELESSNDMTILQYESDSENKLKQRLELIKNKLLKKRKEEARFEDFFEVTKNSKNLVKKPKNRTYWSKFLNNSELNENDKIEQRINDEKEEIGNYFRTIFSTIFRTIFRFFRIN